MFKFLLGPIYISIKACTCGTRTFRFRQTFLIEALRQVKEGLAFWMDMLRLVWAYSTEMEISLSKFNETGLANKCIKIKVTPNPYSQNLC